MKANEMDHTTNQEEQIFLAVLELAPGTDREEFLKSKCGDNHELLKRVEELLSFHQRGDNLLDDTSGGFGMPTVLAADTIAVGTQIGPYKLLQEIGTGGMGVVYMAEQFHPVRRKVAVKIIKWGMDTRNVIARFEAERQALAMMDHPNITKVFDAGSTSSGRPYFVMELVTGLAITDYCDREKLSLRDRIELFYQVCVGVKHAHQKGIIHRDLKPSNVMVTHYDGVAVPKIIDFGIAKAVDHSLTDKTLFTSYGNMIGTPEYMSPEQAEMSGQDIDTRADVYSLGVLMYELLTGTTPFYHWKKKGIHKFCDAICHEEAELASTRINNLADTVEEISRNRGTDVRSLKRSLRGDMDWILSKSMSKKRNERYETAADLARDVKRYLDGQVIEAAGPNLRYRARKFFRKHRTSISLASVIFGTLVIATIVSTVFGLKAISARRLADSRLHEVDQLRKQAENERDRALAAEQKLQRLERGSRIEAAAARAAEKFHRENNDVVIHYANRESNRNFAWAGDSPSGEPPVIELTQEKIAHGLAPEVRIVGVQPPKNDERFRPKVGQPHEFSVLIGDSGDVTVSNDGSQPANTFQRHGHRGDPRHLVIIQDKDGTKQYLKSYVNELRESFGPDDDTVVKTLIEIGNMELNDKDWSEAENSFRESRDILQLRGKNDEQMARVELLMSKAQLLQDKHALARETLKKGVNHLVRLRQVPRELVDVVKEISELDVHQHELQELLPATLRSELEEKLQKNIEIEIHQK